MTIASCDGEVKDLIEKHSIYGVETVVNALVRACKTIPDCDMAYVTNMLQHSFKREEVR
jgi:hypothetical protein